MTSVATREKAKTTDDQEEKKRRLTDKKVSSSLTCRGNVSTSSDAALHDDPMNARRLDDEIEKGSFFIDR